MWPELRRRVLVAALALLAVPQADSVFANPRPRTGYAEIGRLRMYYEVHGAGKPLLILHGGGSTIDTTFGAILPELASRRLVIAPEQQGHGHTGDVDRPFSFRQMADDTAMLLNQLGIDRADVLGFSNGAGVALELALRHPERVDHLVLGSIYFQRDEIRPELLASVRKTTPESMPEPYRKAYLAVAPNPRDLENLTPKIMQNLLGFPGWTEEHLGTIKARTMIIQANQDIAPLAHIAAMAEAIPNAQVLVLPGGHGSYLGEVMAAIPGSRLPDYTTGLILEFLDAD